MSALPEGYRLRRPTAADATAVHALMCAYDVAVYGSPDSDIDDLLTEWDDVELDQDVWLVVDAGGALAGYALVAEDDEGSYNLDFYIHPDHAGRGLAAALLDLAEARAAALAAELGLKASTTVILAHPDATERALLEARDYRPHRYYFQMAISLTEAPPDPEWPAGLMLRTARPDEDLRPVYELIRRSFGWEEESGDFARWHHNMVRADYEPELWFLLFSEAQLVGAALCYHFKEHGWVRQLAVDDAWRRQGLGTRLLQHAFHIFYQRGHRMVALGVNQRNAHAQDFYQRAGMEPVRRYDQYKRSLPPLEVHHDE